MIFSEFNFVPELQEGLDAMGFEKATPIQEQAIPIILGGKDLIATAQTGTGKTAAFILPVLNEISKGDRNGVKVLIIAPTRELAIQIDQQIQGLDDCKIPSSKTTDLVVFCYHASQNQEILSTDFA